MKVLAVKVLAGRLLCSVVLASVAYMGPVTGPAGAVEKKDGKFWMVVGGRQAVSHVDPAQKYDYATRMFTQAMYDGLVKYEGNPPEVKPWLAKDWKVADDGVTWTFNLEPEAKFHNGDPVNADAVVYSFQRVLKMNEGPAWMLSEVLKPENVKAVDEHTVQFMLDKPFAPFLGFLPWWYVVNPKQVQENEKDGDMGKAWLSTNDAGSGPFILDKFDQGTAYWLKRNDNYWKGFPYEGDKMGGVIYRLVNESSSQKAGLLKGDIDFATDLTPEDLQTVQSNGEIVVTSGLPMTSFGLKMNTQNKYTADINLRKAIAYSFDYESLKKIYNGKAKLETSPFTDAIKGKVDVDMPRLDMAKAKDFLAKSKYPDGGIKLEYVYVQGLEEERQIGLSLLNGLKQLNIELNMVPLTWPNMVARAATKEESPDFLAIFATPVSTDPDAVAIQYTPASWGKYYGSSFLDDKELAAMVEEARTITDWDKRAPIYEKIQKRIVENQPEIFGMMKERTFAYRNYVAGYQDSPIRMTGEVDLYPVHIEPK